jgi:RNA polymerase sigma-70 factor (ECF subfamily)
LRVSRERATAEELLQETWIRLAANARRFTPDTDLAAWLFTVARNLYRSHRRHGQVARDLLEQIGLISAAASDDTPFDRVVLSETQRRLEAAIAALPLSAREVLLLSSVERLSPAQVAKVLEISPEAARQRLSRARAMLSAALAESSPRRVPVGESP